MKLNSFERLVVNQPLRLFTQRWLEARPLRRLGGAAPGRVLEIGCGQGLGAQIILRDFGADEVHGFDLDRRQLKRAQTRLQRAGLWFAAAAVPLSVQSDGRSDGPIAGGSLSQSQSIQLWQGSATQIPTADAYYDSVFDFNVLHHVPDWQRGVAEIARVLKPGGKLFLLETLSPFLNNPLGRMMMKHPRENRFNAATLRQGLENNGLTIQGQRRIPGVFSWIVAECGGEQA